MTRLLACLFLAAEACQPAPVGVRDVGLPSDATPQCASLCTQIGLPLDSVVIMANNVGCVCRAAVPAPAPATAPAAGTAPGASASAGGMAAIMIAEEAARQHAARKAAASSRRK